MKKHFPIRILALTALSSIILFSCKKEANCNPDGTPVIHDLSNLRVLNNQTSRTGTGTDDGLIFDCSTCDTTAPLYINSNFNGTPMSQYNYLWVNLHVKLNSYPAADSVPMKIALINGSMDFTADNVLYHATMPNAQIDFSDTATAASSSWNGMYWHITCPRSQISNSELFLGGFAMQIPVGGFPGGIKPLKMNCTFKKNRTENVSMQWQWSAAVYTQFSMDYNDLGVQLIHTNLHAGAPTNYEPYVIGGAMGGGGSNYTGSWSATGSAGF